MAAVAGVNSMVVLRQRHAVGGKIVGIGTWRFSGVTTDMIEVSEMCGIYKTYLCGLKDGGTVSFDGYYDSPASASGGSPYHHKLIDYNQECKCITSLRFYLSCKQNGSYWAVTSTEPNLHGGVAGSGMTGSCIRIESFEIGADKGGLVSISFTGKIQGTMRWY